LSDILINTQEIQAEVAQVEKSLEKLTKVIRALDSAKINSIQAELKKLSSSSATEVQQMAANIQSALDMAIDIQKNHSAKSLGITRDQYSQMLAGARANVSEVAAAEKVGYDQRLAAQMAFDLQKTQAAFGAFRVARRASEDAAIAKETSDMKELVQAKVHSKEMIQVEVNKALAIAQANGSYFTRYNPTDMSKSGARVNMFGATKDAKDGIVASGDYSSLDSGRVFRIRNAEALMNMPSKEDWLFATAKAAEEASVFAKAAQLQVKSATIQASGDYSSLSSGRTFRIRNAELLMNMPSKEEWLFATAKAAEEANASAKAAQIQVKAATIGAVGEYSGLASGRLFRIRNAELFMNMPSKEEWLFATAKAADEATASARSAQAQVKAATIAAGGDYSSLASGRMFRIKNAELFMNMPSKEEWLFATAKAVAEAEAATKLARAQVAAATNSATGMYQRYSTTTGLSGGLVNSAATANAAAAATAAGAAAAAALPHTEALGGAFRKLTVDGNDLHSMARGLSMGFGQMALTYGSILPLLAGAAISLSFAKSVKDGVKFAETLFAIGELAGVAGKDLANMTDTVLSMGQSTQYGPLQLAEGIKVLSLAGLKAGEAMDALKPTLNFAAAGDVKLEAAAATLVSVATAYKYSAKDFSAVGDIIAKTAADTMASVTDMSEAFKTSSVLAQQYGISLMDTATALGMLAQIGIRGTAAGTSWRNMMTEFNKESGKAAASVKYLSIEMKNLETGAARPIMDIMQELSAKLVVKTSKAQDSILQDMTNERGNKATAAFQADVLAMVNKTNPLLREQADYYYKIGKNLEGDKVNIDAVNSAYVKMREKTSEDQAGMPGFAFLKNLEGQFTPLKQYEGALASLETAFVKAFGAGEGALMDLGLLLRATFNSADFQATISAMVGGVSSAMLTLASVTKTAADLIKFAMQDSLIAIGVVIGAYGLYSVAAGFAATSTAWLASVIVANTAVTATSAAATGVAATATGVAATTTGLWTAATLWLTGAIATMNAELVAMGIGLTISTGGLILVAAAVVTAIGYVFKLASEYQSAGTAAQESAAKQLKADGDVAKNKIGSAESIMNSQRDQVAVELASLRTMATIKKSNAEIEAKALVEQRLAFDDQKVKNFTSEKEHLDKAAALRATMVTKEQANARVEGEAMITRINQWADFRLVLAEVDADLASVDKAMSSTGDPVGMKAYRAEAAERLRIKKVEIETDRDFRSHSIRTDLASVAVLRKDAADAAAKDSELQRKKPSGVDTETAGDVTKAAKDAATAAKTAATAAKAADRKAAAERVAEADDLVKAEMQKNKDADKAMLVDRKQFYSELKQLEAMGKVTSAEAVTIEMQKENEVFAKREKNYIDEYEKAARLRKNHVLEQTRILGLLNAASQERFDKEQSLSNQAEVIAHKEKLHKADAIAQAKEYIDLLNKQAAREIAGISAGDKSNANDTAINAIEDKGMAKLRQLARDNELEKYKTLPAGRYEFDVKQAKDATEVELAIYKEKYAKLQIIELDWQKGAEKALNNYRDKSRDVFKQTESLVTKAFQGMEDALVSFAMTGKLDFKSLANSVISDMVRMQLQASMGGNSGVMSWLGKAVGAYFSGGSTAAASTAASTIEYTAKGNVYSSNSLSAYSGQVRDTPTPFMFARGAGVFAEAGPEAIMPLTRGANGKLGVQSSGTGGTVNVTVNVIEDRSKAGTQQTRQDSGGASVIDVFVEKVKSSIATDINRGSGSVPNAMSTTYGLNRVAGAY
jgi:lambda family phage tail tape measure protein/TP901 family phage tail tape measure protein